MKILVACVIAALAFVPAPVKAADGVEHWGGATIASRHFTANNERYCEVNPGVFYEQRRGVWGAQTGYYRNSFCKMQNENRSDDTFYLIGIYQPWRVYGWQIGTFAGPASGYKKGNLVLIGGGIFTREVFKNVAVQVIVNPAAAGFQFKARF